MENKGTAFLRLSGILLSDGNMNKKRTLLEDLPCRNCIHRIDEDTCKAYPNGIPEDYNDGIDIHVEKDTDQVGDYLLETTEEYKKNVAEERARAELEEDHVK